MYNRIIVIGILLAVLYGVSSGCVSRKAIIQKDFSGISAFGQKNDDTLQVGATVNVEDTLNVFITHGVGPQEAGFAQPIINGIWRNLGYEEQDPFDSKSFMLNEDDTVTLTIELYQTEASPIIYRFFMLDWSRFNQKKRDSLFKHDYDNRRNGLIRKLKKRTLTDSFIDFIAYTNDKEKEELNKYFQETVARMFLRDPLTDSLPKDSEGFIEPSFFDVPGIRIREDSYYFISGSLGSKLAIDAFLSILRLSTDFLSFKTRKANLQFYMLSNQIVLLQYLNELQTQNQLFLELFTELEKVSLVVFNDPNDFLGFYLPPRLFQNHPMVDVTNVSLKNARWYQPGKAHEDAKHNRKLLELIIHGGKATSGKSFDQIKTIKPE